MRVKRLLPLGIHVAHHEREQREHSDEQIHPHDGRQVEAEVVRIWQVDREAVRFFEVRNVPQNDDAFADKTDRQQHNPQRITEPGDQSDAHVVDLGK